MLSAFALVVTFVACARQPASQPQAGIQPTAAADCLIGLTGDVSTEQADEVVVALHDHVDPLAAPRPRNPAEHQLFAQLYETLVRVDCRGRVYPGLATEWSAADGDRRWRFVLREDARWWDGTSVSAQDLVDVWRPEEADGELIDSVRAESAQILTLHLSRSYAALPARLAELGYALTRPRTSSPWPEGTGPYAMESLEGDIHPGRSIIGTVPSGSSSGPRVEFRLAAAAADGRDLLDAGVDVLVTRDSRVLEYAALRAEFIVEPLRWDRVYVLLSPTRVRELRAGEPARLPGLTSQLRAALAADAVRGDARGSVSPAWWEQLASCEHELELLRSLPPAVATAAYRVSDIRRVVYARGDEAARGLAERIVALVRNPELVEQAAALAAAIPGIELSVQLLAAELDAADFARALREGDEYLFVVALPTQPLDRCHELMRLTERVPWLDPGRLDQGAAIVPLVETRDHIILRAGTARLQVDWEGTVRVVDQPPPGARQP